MAAYNKHNIFTLDILNAVHNFSSHAFKTLLTNTAPVATNAVYADISGGELGTANGYTAGGGSTPMTQSTASGTAKITATDVVFTATGAVGPFRYADVYNTTPASPLKPLIAWFDYGSSISLANGETFTVDYDGTNGLFTVT